MNSFITPTINGARTVALLTIVSLILSALPVSFFTAAAQELVDPSTLLIDGNPSPTEPGPSPEPIQLVLDGEETNEVEVIVEPEVIVESSSSTEPGVETQVVPPQEEEVVGEAARFQSFSANTENVQIIRCDNLLSNGSFEEPVVTNESKYQFFGTPAGWSVNNVSDDAVTDLEFHRGWSDNQAAEGAQYVELDPYESVVVSQNVTTIPGAVYRLSWAFAPRHNIEAGENKLEVLVNDAVIATEGPATGAAPLAPTDWTRNSYTFTAGAATEVAFKDAGATSDSYGTFLDDAQLCLMREPEPETEDIKVCKYNSNEAPIEDWDMLVTNNQKGEDEVLYELKTGEDGCATVAVDPDNGPWYAFEAAREGWEQVGVYGMGAEVIEGENADYCEFFNYEVVDEGDLTVAKSARPLERTRTCAFVNEQEQAPVCNAEVNLIENGSFEAPALDEEGFGWDVFPSEINGLAWIVEWLFPSEDAPEVPVLEIQGSYFTPAAGNQYAELDSNYNPAPGGEYNGEQAGVRILQTIPTIPGYTYTVSYQFSPKPGYDADSNVLVAKVDGGVKGTHSADGSLLSDTSWTPYTYSFVATDNEAVISFEDAGTQDTFGTLIDAVSVNCAGLVPEDEDEPVIEEEGNRSSGGGGRRSNRNTPTLDEAPEGQVLGEQVSAVPYGAPDTGAGGAAGVGLTFLSVLYVGSRRTEIVKN
jgi:hypothetical protein